MKPILYDHAEKDFDTNGIGVLTDAISCKVLQTLNGQYELTIQYPISGLHFSQIMMRSVILAKVDPVSELQPFRVYRITKPSNGIVAVYARHVAYDLAGTVVTPFTAENAAAALNGLSANAVTDCPFTFTTDKTTSAAFSVAVPTDIWKLLGGSAGSVLDVFGGEYEFDRWNVKLWNRRGMDRGVSIRYGKNLTSLEQDENCANCYTGVMPFWVDRDTGAVTKLSGNIVAAEGNFGYTKILPLDLSREFETAPSEAQLITAAKSYMTANKIGEPVVSWKIEFVQLEQTEEYKGMALLERVLLGDTVEAVFEQMEISAKARAVTCQYDSILERYDYVTLGSVRANIADTIAEQNKEISAKPNKSEMQIAIERLTSTILGAKGGSVRFLDTNGDGLQDTLYIADNADPALAVKVWRFNYEGWGASSNGYNGPFAMGATLDKGFLADFIKAGTLDASIVKVLNLIADHYLSKAEEYDSTLELSGAEIQLCSKGRKVFSVRNWEDGVCYQYMTQYDANGNAIGTSQLGANRLQIGGTGAAPAFYVFTGYDENGATYSNMRVSSINTGKKVLYTGSVTVGSTFEVPNTANYDLFAVKLGSSSGNSPSVALAYKYGNTIYGVGGWCGTATEYKELYFVSITFSGNTWTLVDAGVHDVYKAGSISAGTQLRVREVIGVI